MSPDTQGLLIAEYNSLRQEILMRVQTAHNILSLTLVAAGGFLGAGYAHQVDPAVLLVLPVLTLLLAARWVHNDNRIRTLADYLIRIEDRAPTLGWAKYNRRRRSSSYGRFLGLIGGSGIFVGVQILAIAAAKLQTEFDTREWVMFYLDIGCLALTAFILGTSRGWGKLPSSGDRP